LQLDIYTYDIILNIGAALGFYLFAVDKDRTIGLSVVLLLSFLQLVN